MIMLPIHHWEFKINIAFVQKSKSSTVLAMNLDEIHKVNVKLV